MTDDILEHYGVLRKSGRYPWGSGETPNQRNKAFLDHVATLKKQGLTDTQVAQAMGITTTQLRASKAIAKNEKRKSDAAMAFRLREKGMSNVAIGERMGINESVVRSLLNPAAQERNDVLSSTANMLKEELVTKAYLDIGSGNENQLGISQNKLATAVAMLQEEGYGVHYVKVKQVGTGKMTTVKVLAPPDTPYSEIFRNPDKIKTISNYSEDGGRTFLGLETPRPVDSKRIAVRYAEEGGTDADGVIYVRPGVADISLGGSRYAQVRIAVDGTHYLKGMAMYKDDLPEGVDLLFNTNKSSTGNKLDAMKPLKDDADNPFGAVVRQRHYVDDKGNRQLSTMNIVNEEGDWYKWSKTLSSQMLSKQNPQNPVFAKEQLGITLDAKKAEYEEIMALTNPTVRKKLLESFADDADSSAVHLKAAGLPRTRNHVILPIPDMKDTEVYAPYYRDGEKVVLIRHPHGGTFEIPELTVNNRHRSAKKAIGVDAPDAVGISPKVASILSGADFDGDAVLVIPNNLKKIRTSEPLEGLKDFDPKAMYPKYDGMVPMNSRAKQHAMGDVSNLITDMTIKGANHSEIARAVRHSMVVIDAEKHELNYKQSALDNNIKELKTKYQGGPRAGSDTLISKASSPTRVNERRLRRASEGGPIDPATGKKVWVETGNSWVDAKGRTVVRETEVSRMELADDARTLISTPGTPMERVYAAHANSLKALANSARKSALETKNLSYSPSARTAYAEQVATLNAKLNRANKNKPLERQAQLVANAVVSAKRQANPDMDAETIKKISGQALIEARNRTGARKQRIDLTPLEWEAIQAGAVTNSKLSDILANADLDQVKKLATPRTNTVMTSATLNRAKNMRASGYTPAEIADALGVATSTLNDAFTREDG